MYTTATTACTRKKKIHSIWSVRSSFVIVAHCTEDEKQRGKTQMHRDQSAFFFSFFWNSWYFFARFFLHPSICLFLSSKCLDMTFILVASSLLLDSIQFNHIRLSIPCSINGLLNECVIIMSISLSLSLYTCIQCPVQWAPVWTKQ